MNVLMIEHFLPGSTYTEELCRELQKHVDVTLLCPDTVQALPEIKRYQCVLYGGRRNKLAGLFVYARSLFCTWRLIHRDYDIVHIQTVKIDKIEIPFYLWAMKSCRQKHVKFVATVHNILPHERDKNAKELYTRFYRAFDALIVHNKFCKQMLMDVYGIPNEKIYITPFGSYHDAKPQCENKQDKCVNFLFFGQIRKYKGLDVLLQAISRIPPKRRNDMRFTVAGKQIHDTTDYDRLAKELHIDGNIQWIRGYIDNEKLPGLFKAADACLFPYKEIFGSAALMMAYSYGKPVIASNVPAFLEETDNGRTGLLFESEDSDDLAKQICKFCDMTHEERQGYSQHIAELLKTKYSWKISAEKTAGVYSEVLG